MEWPAVDADPPVRTTRTADGVTIAWTDLGSGPVLVMLPAVPFGNMVGEMRIPFVRDSTRHMARRLHVVKYDGRGSGRSQRDVDGVSLETMLLDLDAVIEAVGDDRVALLGTYHGCALALAYAARHPGRVGGVVLFGGSSRTWDAMSDPQTQALLSLIDRDWDLFVESAAHAWLGWAGPEVGKVAADSFRTATSAGAARAALDVFRGIDVTAVLGSVTAPVIILHRNGSRQIPEAVSVELTAALPAARLVRLPGSSPSLFYEYPRRDADVIADFVDNGVVADDVIEAGPSTARRASGDLTPRELDVLRLIAAGESNAEIGHRLGITVNTVERHAANLYRKIDARGRADATAWAVRRGVA